MSRALAALLAGLLAGGTLSPRLEPMSLASLDGTNGFVVGGATYRGNLGNAVAGAGDVNGDGYDDIVVGAYDYDFPGAAYVIFGAADWSSTPRLEDGDLDGSNGFRMVGVGTTTWTGYAVAGAGDINGDGYDDIVIGSPRADVGTKADAGVAYVVFGKADWTGTPTVDLGSLDSGDGLRLDGSRAGDQAGSAVGGAGDVNGDGYDDLIVGAPGVDRGTRDDAGAAYVVFGKPEWASSARLALAALDGSNGFRLDGIHAGDQAGTGVAIVGDYNGDGLADLAVGAPGTTVGGASEAGEAYVVLGATGFPAVVDLATLDGSNGTRLYGAAVAEQFAGFAVAGAGDLNGDGRADVAVGAPEAHGSGGVYVVFGAASHPAAVDLAAVDGTNGLALGGLPGWARAGYAVAGAGDTNGDGRDDLAIGAPEYPGYETRGATFVVYGKPDWSASPLVDLAALAGSDGRQFNGANAGDNSGVAVGGDIDVNGDGLSDVVVGAFLVDYHDGAAYVVFGKAPPRCRGLTATIFGGNGNDTLVGTPGNDVISGLGGNDIIDGAGGDDVICGDTGDDQITGGPGNDVIDGGSGTDWASFGTSAAPVFASLSTRTATGQGSDTLIGIENLRGSLYGDTLIGNGWANNLQGGSGDDLIRGLGGNDILGGGLGTDTVDYTGAAGRVTVDLAIGVAGGGAGIDMISGFERVIGSAFGDALNGDGAANVLRGMGGNDILRGRNGDDTLDGGLGWDTGDGGSGTDTCLVETATACELPRSAAGEEP